MKITIDIDCTPAEARKFFGLPDLQPMQERLMTEMEQRFRDAVSKVSPEAAMQQWFGTWSAGMEQMRAGLEKIIKSNAE